MNTSVVSPPEARARGVEFVPDAFVVHLQDGRSLTVPIEWFPRLRDATPEQRNHWRLIGPGIGIHWPELDEYISVTGLLGLPDRSEDLLARVRRLFRASPGLIGCEPPPVSWTA